MRPTKRSAIIIIRIDAKENNQYYESQHAEFQAAGAYGTEVEQRIRARAYELYLARGGEPGRAEEDWRLAEEEVRGITGGG